MHYYFHRNLKSGEKSMRKQTFYYGKVSHTLEKCKVGNKNRRMQLNMEYFYCTHSKLSSTSRASQNKSF